MRGRQVRSHHAGRSDGRPGRGNAASADAWQRVRACWQAAYLAPSSSEIERHEREVRYALALAAYGAALRLEAREGERGRETPHGTAAQDAP